MARIVDTTLTMPWMDEEIVQIHPITKIENVIGLSEVVIDVGNNSSSTASNTIINDSQQSEINGLLEALAGSGLISRDTRNVTEIGTSSGDGELPYLYPVTFLESSDIEAISSGANNNTLLVSEEVNGYTITGYNTVKRSPGLEASITMRLYAAGVLIDSLLIVPSKDGEYPVSKHVIHVVPEGASPQLLSVTYECTSGSVDIISGELKVTSNFVAGGAELSNNTDLVTLANPGTATPDGDKTNVTEALAEITIDLGNALSSNSPLDATKLFNTVSKDRLPVASSTTDGIITIGTQSIKGAKTFYDNAIFNGTIQVLGKTITNEVEVVSTSNGIIFEGTVVDDFEGILKAGALSADRIYTLPNKTGTLAMTSDLTPVTNISVVENATTVSINSSTGSDDHIEGATHTKAGVVTNGTQTFGGYKSILNGMTAGTTEAFTSPHLALKATDNVDTVGFVGITFATSTLANYGYSLGSQRTGGGNGEFIIRHHVNNALGSEVLRIGTTGDITGHKFIGPLAGNSSTATKLATPRAIKLTGDVTDVTANFDGSSNIELSLSVKNDSHTHDTRYYTEAESNSRYTIKPGDHTTNNTEYSPVWENNGGVLYTSTANLKYNPGLKTLTSNIFKGNLTGNADTATNSDKLDGKNLAELYSHRRGSIVDNSSDNRNWGKVADVDLVKTYDNNTITLDIFSGYITSLSMNSYIGRISISIRTDTSSFYAFPSVGLWYDPEARLSISDMVVVVDLFSASNPKASLWVKSPQKYAGIVFRDMSEISTSGSEKLNEWTLHEVSAPTTTEAIFLALPGTHFNFSLLKLSNSITGNANTATNVAYTGLTGTVPTWNQNTTGKAANSNFISFSDGPRNLSDRLPNWNNRSVAWDFVDHNTTSSSGNYAGVMTFATWEGTTSSTGGPSYQLAFCEETGVNASGVPSLKLRHGIDTSWKSWHTIAYKTDNVASATTLSGLTPSITELNYVNGVTSAIQTQLNTKLTSSSSLDSTKLTGTISDARMPSTISSNITGNATSHNAAYNYTTNVNGGASYYIPGVAYCLYADITVKFYTGQAATTRIYFNDADDSVSDNYWGGLVVPASDHASNYYFSNFYIDKSARRFYHHDIGYKNGNSDYATTKNGDSNYRVTTIRCYK